MISFTPLSVSPDIPTYGVIRGEFTFVITLIEGRFHASVKKLGAAKFDGTRKELGYHKHFEDAVLACESYYWKHSQ
jgi:hypothetical protein